MAYYRQGDDKSRICTTLDIDCCVDAEHEFKKKHSFAVIECDCLSDCVSISYDVEISQGKVANEVNSLEYMQSTCK